MKVLCLLLSAEIWMNEINLILEHGASFELFELVAQGAEEAQLIQYALSLRQKSKLMLKAHGEEEVDVTQDEFAIACAVVAVIVVILGLTRSRRP